MSQFRGQLSGLKEGRKQFDLVAYDDVIVLVRGTSVAMAQAGFGLIGAAVASRRNKKRQAELAQQVQTLSPQQVAAAGEGVLLPIQSVAEVRLEKGFMSSRKLFVRSADNQERRFYYSAKSNPDQNVIGLFSSLLGPRFVNRMAG